MSELKTQDIRTEIWREYVYEDGKVYRIDKPLWLMTRDGGTGHRVVDEKGVTHWCPVNVWHCIRWYAPDEPVSF